MTRHKKVEDVDEIMPNDVLYVSQGEDFGQPQISAPSVAAAPPAPQFPCVSLSRHMSVAV